MIYEHIIKVRFIENETSITKNSNYDIKPNKTPVGFKLKIYGAWLNHWARVGQYNVIYNSVCYD